MRLINYYQNVCLRHPRLTRRCRAANHVGEKLGGIIPCFLDFERLVDYAQSIRKIPHILREEIYLPVLKTEKNFREYQVCQRLQSR